MTDPARLVYASDDDLVVLVLEPSDLGTVWSEKVRLDVEEGALQPDEEESEASAYSIMS